MEIHGDLLDGPLPPQTRTAPAWPGYDAEPAPRRRFSLLPRARRRRRPSHAAD